MPTSSFHGQPYQDYDVYRTYETIPDLRTSSSPFFKAWWMSWWAPAALWRNSAWERPSRPGYALFDDGPPGNNAALTLAKYVDQLYAEGKLTPLLRKERVPWERKALGRGGSEASPLQRRLPSADDPEASSASAVSAEAGYVAPAYGEEGLTAAITPAAAILSS